MKINLKIFKCFDFGNDKEKYHFGALMNFSTFDS